MSSTGVLTTVGVVVATTEAAAIISRRSLSMRPVIGGFVLGLFLFTIDGLAPAISNDVMALIIVSAILLNGSSLITLLINAPKTAKS